jgi:hypothetical protein
MPTIVRLGGFPSMGRYVNVSLLPADCRDYADQPTTDDNLASTLADRGLRYNSVTDEIELVTRH